MSHPHQRTTTRPHRLTGTLTESHLADRHLRRLYAMPCERCAMPLLVGPYAIEWEQVRRAKHLKCGLVVEIVGPKSMKAYHAGCAPRLMDLECGGL